MVPGPAGQPLVVDGVPGGAKGSQDAADGVGTNERAAHSADVMLVCYTASCGGQL